MALAEWDPLREVMIHKPGFEVSFGLLEPETFLYERHFRYSDASDEHKHLEELLGAEGIRVRLLKNVIVEGAKNSSILAKLVKIADECLKFSGYKNDVAKAATSFERSLKQGLTDPEQLFNITLLNPIVRLDSEHPEVTCDKPMANLLFMRDQQALGDKGIILGLPKINQRRREVTITKLALESLGQTISVEIEGDANFEGGDFLPLGKFALIGNEPRTNDAGISQIKDSNALGFEEIGVVSQPGHPLLKTPDLQMSMHLDTYFNVIGPETAVGCRPLLENAYVTIYKKSGNRYEIVRERRPNLYEYIRAKDFRLVEITELEQLCYASNFLCLKENKIIAVDVAKNVPLRIQGLREKWKQNRERYERLYYKALSDRRRLMSTNEFFPDKQAVKDIGVDVVRAALPNITGGYGGIHCMTCVLSRG